ncbi:MAG: PBP1A family penicillin-binding protein [bacterium]|nr:PBP1A family penicillin-binding protein [bacterium]
MHPRHHKRKLIRGSALLFSSIALFGGGILVLWISTWKLPDVEAFSDRKVTESTKIYDRTGEVLLYDLNAGARRTVIPYTDISRHIKNATVAIEDDTFWQHKGIRFKSIARAVTANFVKGNLLGGQGGSTITQQVVKNTLLTNEKKVSRKLKEWVLARKLEQTLDKETILSLYLNEVPYGGTVYGIEEAAETFFGKSASDVSVAEAAYLAALPNAPTYFSPYGNHRDALEDRKNLVLSRMKEIGFLTEEEYEDAKKEKVTFKPPSETGILAPHFVFFVRQYLEEKYGLDALSQGGLRVTTTLDYDLQKIGEGIVRSHALKNKENFDAENAALVAVDPKTGQILTMVGSRGYFDKEIDGNVNATIALRQPGSAFKPFVYARALSEGYLPETVVFDVPTEFSTACSVEGNPVAPATEKDCYRPINYDEKYRGPISFRDALAQSINIPAIKVLYLAGLKDSLALAQDMGITTLSDASRYGLTLVLGGGEVKLLELTGAYGAFAAEGLKRTPTGILRIESKDGRVLEEWRDDAVRVLEEKTARQITDILSDNRARTPGFGANSPLYFPGRDVAAKTGTTNDYRDAWIVGYTPTLAVGAWAGNNDNRPMQKKVAAFIVAPLWHSFMQEALKRTEAESFIPPPPVDTTGLPPPIRGIWQGARTYFVDKYTGLRATEFTPPELREERAIREVHTILYWIDKDTPLQLRTTSPESDSQFSHWEYAVRAWAGSANLPDQTESVIPTQTDTTHRPEFAPQIYILTPESGARLNKNSPSIIRVGSTSHFPVAQVHYFINNVFIGSATSVPWELPFTPVDIPGILPQNELKVIATDIVGNSGQASVTFSVTE